MSIDTKNCNNKKIAIMQPYFFPYLGYFQLIHAVDCFVFFDDVQFVRKGWMNRNVIPTTNGDIKIIIPVHKNNQTDAINEIITVNDTKNRDKLLKTLEMNYKKKPFFNETMTIIESVLKELGAPLSTVSEKSIIEICKHIGLECDFKKSSLCSPETKGFEKVDRLAQITKSNNAKNYINAIGGRKLYLEKDFKNHDINLFFINPLDTEKYENPYKYSIIETCMNLSKKELSCAITAYKTIK